MKKNKKSKNKKKHPDKNAIFKDSAIDLHIKQNEFSFFSFIKNLKNKWILIKRKPSIRISQWFFCLFLVLILLIQINYLYLSQRIIWNSNLDIGIEIGGLKQKQIETILNNFKSKYLDQKITFKVNDKLYAIHGKQLGLYFDIDQTSQEIFKGGHNDNYIEDLLDRSKSIFYSKDYKLPVSINTKKLKYNLQTLIPELENKAINSTIILKNNLFKITEESQGTTSDFKNIAEQIITNIRKQDYKAIEIKILTDYPEISKTDNIYVLDFVNEFKNKKIKLNTNILKKSFELKLNDNLDLIRFSDIYNFDINHKNIVVDIDPNKLQKYLIENISSEINREREDTYLTLNDNLEVTANGLIKDGYKLNIPKTIEIIRNYFANTETKEQVELVIDIDHGKIIEEGDINTGITELIAYGESDFSGSPNNRRHNIDTAMNRFQNIIIMPGEKLSFNEYLGPVNKETGYKEELVIKEGGTLTIAEYGGGVCQVSTTLFRAALYGGYKIVQRRGHSYKVVYYNPDGLDATIYPPIADFVFENDTPFPILIQNTLNQETSTARFNFYSTKIGREIELDGPHRYNFIKKPKETKTIYLTQKPNWWRVEKKGHNGFSVYWTRKIKELNQEEKEEKFYSVYKAIPNILQLGGTKPVEATSGD